MKNVKYLYKEAFAVIGKAGHGSAYDPQNWILPLWEDANAHFAEINDVIRKNKDGEPLGVWGAMNDADESNKRWGEIGKYMASYEADVNATAPSGWTKWVVPSQTYLIAECTMDTYSEVYNQISNDPNIKIIGTVHEHYPNPGNPNIVELYFPIAEGKA